MKPIIKRVISLAVSLTLCLTAVPMAGLSADEIAKYPIGDLSLDGHVTADDLTVLVKGVSRITHLPVGQCVFTEGSFPMGDITLDGEVGATDVTKLARAVGNIEALAENLFAFVLGDLLEEIDGGIRLYAPSRETYVDVTTENGDLRYSLYDGNRTWLKESDLGVTLSGTAYYESDPVVNWSSKTVSVSYPLMGNQSKVEETFHEAALELEKDNYSYQVVFRVFDNGVAFRYVLPEIGTTRTLSSDDTTFVLPDDTSVCWYGVNDPSYEPEVAAHKLVASGDKITPPMSVELENGVGYMSVLEGSTNETYPGFCLQNKGEGVFGTTFNGTVSSQTGAMTSGWKLVNFSYTLNGLINNYNVYAVADAPDEELYGDTSWIEPGHSTWSWGSENNQGAVNEANMARYIRAAGLLGFEYNIIDDGWPAWEDYATHLGELGVYGESMGVKQILWSAQTAGTDNANKLETVDDMDAFLDLLEMTHMSGSKMDFWRPETESNTIYLQKYVLTEAAKRHMILDFHGCAKNTGWNITFPNEMTREGVRGTEFLGPIDTMDADKSNRYAKYLTTQLYTRFLGGHADFTPGCNTAMELGSLVLVDSPLMVISTSPEKILANPAVEFIKSMPTVWDETVVLPGSVIGSSAIYAKRNNQTWFVGGVFSAAMNNVTVNLSDFITEEDGAFLCDIWDDNGDGTKSYESKVVTASDVITLKDKGAAQGFALRLTKLTLSSYGGEVGTMVSYTAVDEEAVVKYTMDGTDPMTSATAKVFDGSVEVTEAGKLRVAITEGDGAGTECSGNFAVVTYYTGLDYDIAGDGDTLTGTGALAEYVLPDVALTETEPTSATGPNSKVDWGTPQYNESKFSGTAAKIELGGSAQGNGYTFDTGIACNAAATFVYAVPAGFTRFTAAAGIDGGVYTSSEWSSASGVVSIQFDGETVYTSPLISAGHYVLIDVEIPAGAQEMTILFTDGGNGNTADNLALGGAGWVE